MTRREWLVAHRRLSHDWLRNRLITGLRGYERLVDGEVTDSDLAYHTRGRLLTDWNSRLALLESLADTFEEAMSAARLLEEPPLRWRESGRFRPLLDFTDYEWRRRTEVDEWLGRLRCVIDIIRAAKAQFSDSLTEARPEPGSTEGASSNDVQIARNFAEVCEYLARLLEQHPKTTLVK